MSAYSGVSFMNIFKLSDNKLSVAKCVWPDKWYCLNQCSTIVIRSPNIFIQQSLCVELVQVIIHLSEQARKSSCKHGRDPENTESHPAQSAACGRNGMKRDGGITRAAQKGASVRWEGNGGERGWEWRQWPTCVKRRGCFFWFTGWLPGRT